MHKIFTCDGYDFWRDESGHWNVAHKGDAAPTHCAYASPEAIARLKGCNLRDITWAAPQEKGRTNA